MTTESTCRASSGGFLGLGGWGVTTCRDSGGCRFRLTSKSQGGSCGVAERRRVLSLAITAAPVIGPGQEETKASHFLADSAGSGAGCLSLDSSSVSSA